MRCSLQHTNFHFHAEIDNLVMDFTRSAVCVMSASNGSRISSIDNTMQNMEKQYVLTGEAGMYWQSQRVL